MDRLSVCSAGVQRAWTLDGACVARCRRLDFQRLLQTKDELRRPGAKLGRRFLWTPGLMKRRTIPTRGLLLASHLMQNLHHFIRLKQFFAALSRG